MPTTHVLKVSLPETVYKAAAHLAAQQGVSLEQLAREAIASTAARPAEMDLTEAYELLADDVEETNVEIFLEAQLGCAYETVLHFCGDSHPRLDFSFQEGEQLRGERPVDRPNSYHR